MDSNTAGNPPTADNEYVNCSYCGKSMMMRNLIRHNERKHASKSICWTIPNLKIKKLSKAMFCAKAYVLCKSLCIKAYVLFKTLCFVQKYRRKKFIKMEEIL